MTSDLHYERDGQPAGPVSVDQMKTLVEARIVTRETRVWRPGMPAWTNAGEALADLFAHEAPPLPPSPPPLRGASGSPPPMPPATRSVRRPWKDNATFAQIIQVFCWIALIVSATFVFGVIKASRRSTEEAVRWLDFYLYDEGINTATGLFSLAFIVAFLVWLYRATANLEALGASALSISPGWAVGWFFIPVANVWVPYQAATQLYGGSFALAGEAPPAPRYGLPDPLLWWLCLLLGLATAILASAVIPEIRTVQDVKTVIVLSAISEAAVVPAAFSLIRFVKAVTAAQARAARARGLRA